MRHFIGLMSGTSLDGVDAALVGFDRNHKVSVKNTAYLEFPDDLKHALLTLHFPGPNEIELSQLASIQLAKLYADAIANLMKDQTEKITAIGCHGQTVRHRPDLGFSIQLNNPSLLAELTGLPVIADFRNRDIAAQGQGAPLVPAFHRAVFADPEIHRVVVNIGGISNLTDLPTDREVIGFDCGPGNMLMDAWCLRHQGYPYDRDGAWAASGKVIKGLLENMLAEPFFATPPPKSTGRDLFGPDWLNTFTTTLNASPQDIQATLLELSAHCIADSISQSCRGVNEVYLCGGGTRNIALCRRLQAMMPHIELSATDELGIPADWVEAVAFAWLAKQAWDGQPASLPSVTGAKGPRILGAIYPA